MSERPSHIGSDGVDFRTAPLHECLYGKNPQWVWMNLQKREEDECQPTYCDCEGFCTGACRLRNLERLIDEQRRVRQELKKTISRANDEIIRVTDSICVLERQYDELLERFK
jgi:hypothetical protein